ncbi:MAG: ATP-binding cassette domain-containing protein, partial [Polyangia bacterium]
MKLVELLALEVGYHCEAVLPPVNLAVEAGAAIGIVGPNGSGKTTLVRTMLALQPPISGAIK